MIRRIPYFTSTSPRSGPLLWRDDLGSIDVLENPRDPQPIGTARPVGRTEGGIAVWAIVIRGEEVPGRWIVLGREFLLKR